MKLTEEQQRMVKEAIGAGSSFPKFTQDPHVNHAVDMLVCDYPPWEDLAEKERQLYFDEIEAAKEIEK